ncbi:MAG: hypothetical protein A2Z91_06495 [Deltaproteobacteria bacterium GWA2_38_16]|nr:MAG: hypothetical protein A2Z91_06495 [Deltaproteobacteria bacterium GWA2_38_16]OGQ03433.1 MAG: hypothetical protein A3D19_04915 [Deltaproteobacteria bacterium RIFCSPHIGHO2_02_FULL_38_15]OGQ30104.1 MAG: hypothetical protein A3A72_06985 [Deltaproteobacteria bacterium RIFCSPLOWO2_01_FULL_38_9]HBQ21355.1 hypothetical protein [Deltaproteobacteria bacterium]
MKKQIFLLIALILIISNRALADPPIVTTNMELPSIAYHPILASFMDKISELKTQNQMDETIPIYFDLLGYVEDHPTEKMPYIPQASGSQFLTIEQFVIQELLTLAAKKYFERPELKSTLLEINAEIKDLYREAQELHDLSGLEKNIPKIILSSDRLAIFQFLIAYHLERGELSKALYYITIQEKIIPEAEKVVLNRQKKLIERLTQSAVAVLPQEEAMLPSGPKKNGRLELPLAFQKRRYDDGFQIHLHPEGFIISDNHIISDYNFDAQKMWEKFGNFSSVITAQNFLIAIEPHGISIIDMKHGVTKVTLSQEKLGAYVPHPNIYQVGNKIFIPALENKRAYSLLIIDLNHPNKMKPIYLGDFPWAINRVIKSTFVQSEHILYLSNNLSTSNFGINIDQETLQATFLNNSYSYSLDTNTIWQRSLLAIVDGKRARTKTLSGEISDFNPPLFFKNLVFIPRPATNEGNSIEVSIHEPQKLNKAPIVKAYIPALPTDPALQILGIHRDLVFVKADDSLKIYTLRPLAEAYLNNLQGSLNKFKDPQQKISFLLQFISEKPLEVRQFVKTELVKLGLQAVPNLLAAIDEVPYIERGNIEEILEELLSQTFEKDPKSLSQQDNNALSGLFTWGIPRILDQKRRMQILSFIEQKKEMTPQELTFVKTLLQDQDEALRAKGVETIIALAQSNTTSNKEELFEILLTHFKREESPAIRKTFLSNQPLFPLIVQKNMYLIELDEKDINLRTQHLSSLLDFGKSHLEFQNEISEKLVEQYFKELVFEDAIGLITLQTPYEQRNEIEKYIQIRRTLIEQTSQFSEVQQKKLLIAALKDSSLQIRHSATKKLLHLFKTSPEGIFNTLKQCFKLEDIQKTHEEWTYSYRWSSYNIRKTIISNSALFSNEEQFDLLSTSINIDTGYDDGYYDYIRHSSLITLFYLAQKEGFKERVFELVNTHFDHESTPKFRHLIVYQWGLEVVDLPQAKVLLEKAVRDENSAVRLLAQAFLNILERN